MNAPEKLYLHIRPNKEIGSTWHGNKISDTDIEYVRKDAFIEKACNAYCKVCGHYPHTVPTHICRNNCNYYSDFKRYMEDKL